MIITPDFVFVHIPKTGGHTITSYFRRQNGSSIYWGGHVIHEKTRDVTHIPAREIPDIADDKTTLNQKTWFTVVRNPYDRVYSAYSYLKQFKRLSFEKFFMEHVYNPWKMSDKLIEHVAPMVSFVTSEDIQKYNIQILHNENLDKEFAALVGKPLPSAVAVTHHIPLKDGYKYVHLISPEIQLRIEEVYAKDFETFGIPKLNKSKITYFTFKKNRRV